VRVWDVGRRAVVTLDFLEPVTAVALVGPGGLAVAVGRAIAVLTIGKTHA
jgi:hypothetical protein